MHLDYQMSTLSNGVRVVSSLIPHSGSVAMGFWVGVGGRYEPEQLGGVSHFIEHLLFKGTKTRSARQISEAIEGRGGYFNAFTQEESTCYYARIGASHARQVLDILIDMYLQPRLAAADIDKERGVIIEEIMMYRDQPQQVVVEKLGEMLWSKHALGRPLTGLPEVVAKISRKDLVHFKESNYCPENTIVAFAGKLNHDNLVAQLEKSVGKLKKGKAPEFTRVTKKTRQESVAVVEKETEQTHLAMGFRLFGRHDKRRYILKLLSVILGENMSSRLFQSVREKHGLAYAISSGANLFSETGVLEICAGMDKKKLMRAMALIISELNKMKRTEVSAVVLKRAKDYAIGQLAIGLESTSSQMIWAGDHLLAYDTLEQPNDFVEKITAVTATEIRELAAELMQPERLSVAVVTAATKEPLEKMIKEQVHSLGV